METMACMKFSHDEETFIIEQYKNHRYLWDIKDEKYFDKRARCAALKDITGLFIEVHGRIVTEEDIKKKWRNLRCTFTRELRKLLKSAESENGEIYRSKWLHYKELQYLKDDAISEINLISVVEGMDCSDMENSLGTFKEECNLTSTSVQSRTPDRNKYVSPTIMQLTGEKVPNIVALKSTQQADSIDDFLSYVGKSLRKLPEFNIQRCILKMQNALFEEFEAVENC